MKDYPVISKFAITLSIIGILVAGINWLFGIINEHMTSGASIVILISLMTVLFANISIAESGKKKKQK